MKRYSDLVAAVRASMTRGGDDYDIIERVSRKEGISLTLAKEILVSLRKAA